MFSTNMILCSRFVMAPQPVLPDRVEMSRAELLRESRNGAWQRELERICDAFVAKISSLQECTSFDSIQPSSSEALSSVDLVSDQFDHRSSRICCKVNSFALEAFRLTVPEPSPVTLLPVPCAILPGLRLSPTALARFDERVVRGWPLHPSFPSLPLTFGDAFGVSAASFSNLATGEILRSLVRDAPVAYRPFWGSKEERRFARFETSSFSVVYSTDSKLGRAQLQMGTRIGELVRV